MEQAYQNFITNLTDVYFFTFSPDTNDTVGRQAQLFRIAFRELNTVIKPPKENIDKIRVACDMALSLLYMNTETSPNREALTKLKELLLASYMRLMALCDQDMLDA